MLKFVTLFTFLISAQPVFSENTAHVFLWQVQAPITDAEMAEIKQLGVTTIQSFGLLEKNKTDVQNYLDLALKYDLKVMAYLQRYVERIDENQGCRLNEKGKQMVKTYHQHKAIYAWHTLDEPVIHDWSKQCQQDLHDYIKSVDPNLKVMISTNIFRQEHYDDYFQPTALDIMDLHKYSNPIAGWKQLQMLELYKENQTKKNIELIITLRAYNAPHKKLRKDMTADSLIKNYNTLFRNNSLTESVGFYGWDLSTNLGIIKSDYIRQQFMTVLDQHQIAD